MWTWFGGGISDIAHTISERVSCQLILLIWSHFFEFFKFWIDRGTWFLLSEIVWALSEIPPPKYGGSVHMDKGAFALFSPGFRVVFALLCEKNLRKTRDEMCTFLRFRDKSCACARKFRWAPHGFEARCFFIIQKVLLERFQIARGMCTVLVAT